MDIGIVSMSREAQLIVLPCILFALTFHEYAHAFSAYLLGDRTAYYNNRMNMNPLREQAEKLIEEYVDEELGLA